jgi:gamma-glutamylcyclotransferase (GGCT)/AIG2-like uncharacterized protein YtfP
MRYFAYGSNMSSGELRRYCPGARFVAVASLRDYRLDFTRYSAKRGGGVADIVAHPGESVWGILWDVPDDELPALDRKEGVPVAYRRVDVTVEAMGEHVAAVAHAVVDKEPSQPPSRDYLDLLLAGAREFGLPDDYVAALASLPCQPAATGMER